MSRNQTIIRMTGGIAERHRAAWATTPYFRGTTRSGVEIYDSHHPDSVFDPTGGRWVTYCVTHGSVANHSTLESARAWAKDVSYWCEAGHEGRS